MALLATRWGVWQYEESNASVTALSHFLLTATRAGSAPVLEVWSSKSYCDQPHRVPELERSANKPCTRSHQ